jgi:DNA-binding transcriptional ArsR family regulator
MEDVLEKLAQLGFGEYEARAYLGLLAHSPVNGYELARQSGVPRGSIYGTLARLEEKGAVTRLEESDGTLFAPVAPDQLLQQFAGRFQRTLGYLERRLEELAKLDQGEPDQVWNMRGYGSVVDHARALTGSAQSRLSLAVWPQESAALSDDTAAAAARGVDVRTLCLANCPQECRHCRGHVHRYDLASPEDKRWLVLIPDGREVLAAEISDVGASASAVRTRQRLLVDLAESYIRQSIALAAITSDLQSGLVSGLSTETRDVLASLQPAAGVAGWLREFWQLLGSDRGEHAQLPDAD